MAGPNLPSIQELGAMEFLSPMMFQQAQDQTGLANQFAQQNLASGGQDLQSKILANLFQQQNDPQKLQHQQLVNQGLGNANALSGVNARLASGTEQEALAARRADLLAKASDDELKSLRNQAEKEYESDDPAVRARGEKKLMASVAEFNRRNKTNDAVAIASAKSDDRMALERMRQDSMTGRNNDSIAGRASVAAAKNAAAAKKAEGSSPNAEKAAVRAQMLADDADTPEERDFYLQQAKNFTAYSMALKNAGAGTKPDMAQFGIQTNVVNTGMGSPNAIAAPRSMNAPPRTNGAGDPPAGSGLVSPQEEAQTRALMNLSQAEDEYVRTQDPAARQVLAEQIKRERAALQQPQAAGQPAQQAPAAPAKTQAPSAGTIYKGYRFKGGDPANKANWEKV